MRIACARLMLLVLLLFACGAISRASGAHLLGAPVVRTGGRRGSSADPWWSSPRLGEVGPDDVLHFEHLMKTGGTSLSDLLKEMFGEDEGVFPGSHRSGHFQTRDLEAAISAAESAGVSRGSLSKQFRVAYCHCDAEGWLQAVQRTLPEAGGPQLTARGVYPGPSSSPPRLHKMVVLRDPAPFVAAHFNEWICGVKRFLNKPQSLPMLSGDGPCRPNMTIVRDMNVQDQEGQCRQKRGKDCAAQAQARSGFCNDPAAFLQSNFFQRIFGRDKKDWQIGERVCGEQTSPKECYSRALSFFQGFLLVGVTERMHDVQCLLHFYTKKPWKDMGHERKSPCKPLDLFSPEARRLLDVYAQKAKAVYKAAVDVLTHRLGAAKLELEKLKSETGADIRAMPHIGPGCFGF